MVWGNEKNYLDLWNLTKSTGPSQLLDEAPFPYNYLMQRNTYVFTETIFTLLGLGVGKNRNILLDGPANCGKIFLLSQLSNIWHIPNPSSSKYASCKYLYVETLNDLKWSHKMSPWPEFLNSLEGQKVHLNEPKTNQARETLIKVDVLIFATSIARIMSTGKGCDVEEENAIIRASWALCSDSSF